MKFKYYKELIGEKFNKKNVKNFIKRQGFYIILFVCVAAVGVTALIVAGNQSIDMEQAPQEEVDAQGVPVENQMDETLVDLNQGYSPYPTPELIKETTADITNAPKSQARLSIRKPISGIILNEFSGDIVVFNESLNQWASHNAVDIEAKVGDKVFAAKAGEVIDVYEDALLGGVVIIAHGKDMKSAYKNIIPDPDLSPQDKVDEGSEIGTIGVSGLKEDYLGPHLHFEFYINDVAVDPQKYFK